MIGLLEAAGVTVAFGGVTALEGVSFTAPTGSFCAVIGPNGAGKTTLFNVLTGLVRPRSGSVRYDDVELTKASPHRLTAMGVARTFQNLALCEGLTVVENVMLGAHHGERSDLVSVLARTPGVRRSERAVRAHAMQLLERFGLADKADSPAGGLPYGSLKRVELARALAAEPSLLLLDEPAAGLNYDASASLRETLRELHQEQGLSVVLVEHHMEFVMSLADHVVVLDFGRVLAAGRPQEIVNNPDVIKAYLGADAA